MVKKVAMHAGCMPIGKNGKGFMGGEWWNEW